MLDAKRNIRQRKSESREAEKKPAPKASDIPITKPTPTPPPSPIKSFLGYVAFVLAALLYVKVNYFPGGIGPTNDVREGAHIFPADVKRRDAVVGAFKHAWLAYERDAMGDDEYHPISRKGSNLTSAGGIGYTVVDALDTIQLMGLKPEYARARKWIANSLSFDRNGQFNTFEVTIRVLGGLLSSYILSGEDPIYLSHAQDLGDRLLPSFGTPSGLPTTDINLGLRKLVEDPSQVASTAEASTIQLELRFLSYLTDNEEYWDRSENVMKIIKVASMPSGLPTIFMGTESGQFLTSQIRLGSRGDSFYEYLLKQYLQTNQTEPVYRDMYESSMTAIHNKLLKKSLYKNLTYSIELIPERGRRGLINWNTEHKQDHLVCFLGGSLMLGATTAGAVTSHVSVPPLPEELSESAWRDWNTGVEIIETCVDTYQRSATGLAPEIVHFRTKGDGVSSGGKDWYIRGARPAGQEPTYDARYMLRPETIESLFIAYRLTGDERYRTYAWDIFQAIEKYCRVETGGYATILNVDDIGSKLEDKMETFMMSETLKYLYLLFSDSNVLPLDKYVFNTEAHPLPIFTPHSKRAFADS